MGGGGGGSGGFFVMYRIQNASDLICFCGLVLALATADGFVRIFDFHGRELIGQMKSYFGAMLCVAWSGDGILLAAGAEDDLVHVYSMQENRVILRCQGHR